ncbi:probable cytochrome P450 6a13 [Bradysia coprophila]|uniref:probable cytochrome P450 6a13 n=1 Tax=Bradysia coprophila TaxID=38358 RepID=UPI00187D8E36|nr:probable cytochrome P450 6a13 [Bradysia coprophila]
MDLLYGVIGVFLLAYYWVKRRYNFWNNRGFVSPKASFPFGSLGGVGSTITSAEAFDNYYKTYKGKAAAVGVYFFLKPTILPIDPELCKSIFVRDFSSFHERGFYYNAKDDPLSANLLSIEGQVWRDRRTSLSPIFTSGKMKMMFDIILTLSHKLVDIIDNELNSNHNFEMRSWAQRFTGDVIGNVAFGLDCKCLDDPDSIFLKHSRRLSTPTELDLLKFLLSSSFPDLCRRLHFRSNPKEIATFFHTAFIDTMKYRTANHIDRNDFVSMLLGLKDLFTTDELAAESFIVYIGGFETSSTLISFTMYELALNTDVQERLRYEIKSGLDDNNGELTYEMLFGFRYLDMVVNEVMRKYPPIPNTFRKCNKDFPIPETNLVIPDGVLVNLNIFSFHRDPEYYPDPDKFDPERFTPENCKQRHPFTFMPFGEGPRNCIGSRFGLMQAKVAVVKLIENYKISINNQSPIPMKFEPSSPFLAPVGGMWLNLDKLY